MAFAALLTVFFAAPILFTFVVLCLLIGLLYADREGWATFALIVVVGWIVGGYYVSGTYIDWGLVSLGTVLYLVVGLGFVWPKWFWSYVPKKARQFADFKTTFAAGKEKRIREFVQSSLLAQPREVVHALDRDAINGGWIWTNDLLKAKYKDLMDKFRKEYIDEHRDHRAMETDWNRYNASGISVIKVNDDGSITTSHNKPTLVARLTTWMIHWPIYTLLFVLEDVIRNIVEWFVTHVGHLFNEGMTKAFNQA